MLFTRVFDVAGPEVLVGMGLSLACAFPFFILLVALVEAAVMTAVKWGSFRAAFLPALVMNLVTTLLGAVLFAFGYVFYASNAWPGLLAAFIISTLVEGGILVLFKRAPHRRNWIAALAANLVSYAVLAVILLLS